MTALQGLRMALAALGAHKLRSALTLVGIVAGVASIIAIMTGISVVQAAMEKELSVLGTTTFQVQKSPPRGFGNRDGDRRRIQLRAPLTASQADAVREGVDSVDLVGREFVALRCASDLSGQQHGEQSLGGRRNPGVSGEQHPSRASGAATSPTKM
jgi:hypothetical protein